MASTKKKRRTKHRGNAAGIVESRGRTGRKPADNEKKASDNKMATCNTKSKGLKGDEHKKFMSECMKATS